MLTEPTPLEVSVSSAIEWVEWAAATPWRIVVQVRVLTPDSVPSPGTVVSATSLVLSRPARLVQPMCWYDAVLDPTGIWPPFTRLPKPELWKAYDVARCAVAPPSASWPPTTCRRSRARPR